MIRVGAPWVDAAGEDAGAIYLFRKEASGQWIQVTRLLPSDPRPNEHVGWSVAISGDIAGTGPYSNPDEPGSVRLFHHTGSDVWIEADVFTASDSQAFDSFGLSLSLLGDTLLIGAPGIDQPQGAAYVFQLDCPPVILGDLDGDGDIDFADLLLLIDAWGECPEPPAECPADLTGDGSVGLADLLTILHNWSS